MADHVRMKWFLPKGVKRKLPKSVLKENYAKRKKA
jgi:hypothetical protein